MSRETLSLPLVIEPRAGQPGDLVALAQSERSALLAQIARHGGILLRGFSSAGIDSLRGVAEALCGSLMEYHDRAAHRTRLEGRVYTAADYPSQHELFLHNESTYAATWPMKLFLHCLRPAESGGQTPLADVRRVLACLSLETRREFAAKGLLYVRNFGGGLFGPSWQDSFQTRDPDEMLSYCRGAGIAVEFLGTDRVRTRQARPAIARHPVSREPVWFNHAAALHVSTLPERTRQRVQKLFAEGDYPSNVYFGDGSAIDAVQLDEIRQAYRSETVTFDWRACDLLVLDNMLVAHGRRPFEGKREMAFAMAEPMGWSSVEVVGPHDLR